MTLCLLKAGSIPAVSLNVYEREGQGDGQCRGELARQVLKRFRKKMRRLGTSQYRSRTQQEHSMILACVAWRFWLGALSNKRRARAEKPRGDWGGSSLVFIFLAASPLVLARPTKTAMLRRLAWFKFSQMTFGAGDASQAYFSLFFFAGRVGARKRSQVLTPR